MKMLIPLMLILLATYSFAQRENLNEVSEKLNKDLPEVYDPITKLVTTTVQNNDIKFNFIVDASEKEFKDTLPKVKLEVLNTVCRRKSESYILNTLKANIIYSYENVKGQSLGEFVVRIGSCKNIK
jgi:hypothetical protein